MAALFLFALFQIVSGDVIVPCPSGATCLKVGFVYQTGTQETEGMNLYRGYVFWANRTNAEKPIVTPWGSFQVELHAYNDSSNVTLTSQYYERLIVTDGVNYTLGPFGSSFTQVAMNVTDLYNYTLIFSQAADDALFANYATPTYNFGIMTEGSNYMETAMAELRSLGANTVAVLRSTSGFTTSVWGGFLKEAANLNLNILVNISYNSTGTQNFTDLLLQVKKAAPNPDIFLSLSLLAEGQTIVNASRSAAVNYQPKAFVMTSPPDGANAFYITGPDQWQWDVPLTDPFFTSAKTYSQDYLNMFNTGESHATSYSAGASVTGYVLSQALANSKSSSQLDLRDALAALNMSTMYGNITFNITGQNIAKEMLVTQVLRNATYSLESILVGPAPMQVLKMQYPIPYGCTNPEACNWVKNDDTIENYSCTTDCLGGASSVSLSSSYLAMLFITTLSFGFWLR